MAKKIAKKKVAKKKVAKKKVAKKVTKKKATKKKAAEPLIVASKVKAFIKAQDKMTASETLVAINAKVYEMLEAAVARTDANGRKTVKPQDL